MAARTILFASALVASPAGAALTLRLFSPEVAAAYGAYCLDGSPGGFYYAPPAAGVRGWVIFLNGGGVCYTDTGSSDTNCAVRAKTALGSSTYWSASMAGTGILDSDPAHNPNFATFGKAYDPYCTGDAHSGTRRAPASADFPFIFAGHNIVRAIIDTLLNETGIAAAEHVLLAGDSAGGIGTFLNADYVGGWLGPGVGNYRANPQAGWFFPRTVNYTAFTRGDVAPPYAGDDDLALANLWAQANVTACVAALGRQHCGTADSYYRFIRTPLFVTQNQCDSNQVFAQQGAPNSPAAQPYFNYTIARTRESTDQVRTAGALKPVPDGLFAMACLAHVENTNPGTGVGTTVGGFTLGAALGSWFFGTGAVPRVLADTCEVLPAPPYVCNPSCPAPAAAAVAAKASGPRWFV